MSIIHDALKKVQNSMEERPSLKNPLHILEEEKIKILPSTRSNKENKTKPSHSKLLIILSLLIVIGVSTFWILSQIQNKNAHLSQFKIQNTPGPPLALSPQVQIPEAPVLIEAPLQTPPTDPIVRDKIIERAIINLQGIMTTNNKNIALINSKIYEEGKNVGEIKILKINLNSILIEEDGKQTEVSLNK